MSSAQSQGSIANRAGKALEKYVEDVLKSAGVLVMPYREWRGLSFKPAPRVLLKNVPYTTIYGSRGIGEFVLMLEGQGLHNGIRIECRSQHVAGSVDEKLPYLFENALAFDQKNVIIVLDGNGFKKGAKEWLINKARSVAHKNIDVVMADDYEFEYFIRMVMDTTEV